MNPVVIIFSGIGVLFLAFVLRLLSLSSVGAASPWWMYVIFLGIVFSGVMYVYSIVDERNKEQRVIEKEGRLFLDKYKNERKDLQLQKKF